MIKAYLTAIEFERKASKQMKLWIDDDAGKPGIESWRNPPDASWTVAHSSDEAINLTIAHGFPAEMDLDHDLGDGDTVMNYLKWLADVYYDRTPVWKVHSRNPEGAKNIVAFLNSWIKSKSL